MTEIDIYFNDLAETIQEQLWRKVTKDLLDNGEVSPKGKYESEEEFQRRLEEEKDYYINTHNLPTGFLSERSKQTVQPLRAGAGRLFFF